MQTQNYHWVQLHLGLDETHGRRFSYIPMAVTKPRFLQLNILSLTFYLFSISTVLKLRIDVNYFSCDTIRDFFSWSENQ